MNKPKRNYKPGPIDDCQTPSYALDAIIRFLKPNLTVWEPAVGEGLLAGAMRDLGLDVIATGLPDQDFFEIAPPNYDCIITNPPFSLKYKWLKRCYELGKPFFLLLPVETLGAKSFQVLASKHGCSIILMDRRINFKMPNKGWEGQAQFPTAWFMWNATEFNNIYYHSFSYLTNEVISNCQPK